jgi:chloramphenicol-sensitive protein RarD
MAPLYWPLLAPASAFEILAHRMTWSLIFLAILNVVRSRWDEIAVALRDRRSMKLLSAAAVLITINWGLYIWSVVNDHVIDAAFGYFLNPLVNVAFGVLVFREQLRRLQWVAVGIAASGVLFLTIDAGTLPWIGLILGTTFSAYGMVKKKANVDAVESMTIETILLLPFSASYLMWLFFQGNLALGQHGGWHTLWTLMAGVVTAVPLLAFGAAAVRVPYSTMGILQYGSPTIQFLIGLLVYNEAMSAGRWTGFIIVWMALVVFTIDAIRAGRNFATSEE